jgi:fucose permease
MFYTNVRSHVKYPLLLAPRAAAGYGESVPWWMFLGLLVIAMGVAVLLKRGAHAQVVASERLPTSGERPRKWWQHQWYFFLSVALFFSIGVYSAAVGHWTVASIYFVAATFSAVVARRRWERYGKPSRGGR